MLRAVREFIARHGTPAAGDTVLAACSGGPDSVALVHALAGLKGEYGFTLAVAHVNHLLRGAESDADAAFVDELAARLGLPFYQTSVDAASYAEETGRSLQDAARAVRWRWLRATAAGLGGAVIATGHHADDQAETVLLNLFRGAGSAGLAGMKPAAAGIIRPLLAVDRAAIDDYCREHGLASRLDSSNLSTDYQRNLLRLEVMPRLAAAFNANLAATLGRTAQVVGDEHEYVAGAAAAAWPRVARQEGEALAVDCRALAELPVALRREVFRQALEKKRGNLTGISFLHVEKLLELASEGTTGNAVTLPGGLTARREYGDVLLTAAVPPAAGITPPGVALAVPGTTEVPVLGATVTARLSAERPPDAGPDSAVFAWDELSPPLYVRTRADGDVFRPAGLGGSKKLKEFFIDAKVPRRRRDGVPVIADSRGILWLAGLRQAERGRAGAGTQQFLQLIMEKRED